MLGLGLGLGFSPEEEEHKEITKKRTKKPKRKQEQYYSRSGTRRRARKNSPDSMIVFSSDHNSNDNHINTAVRNSTNGSLSSSSSSSSASGSLVVDRCSFGSDHDAIFSQFSLLHLAGLERSSGPDPDPKKRALLNDNKLSSQLQGPEDTVQSQEEGDETLDPETHSFSHALRECQNRRFRSEGRPASVDLNNVLSPRFFVGVGGMKMSSAASSRSRSGIFPSPGTPNYRHSQKGWSSERVPLPANCSRRYGGNAFPFNIGKALPSKWEDAEKWIFSPVSGDGTGRPSVAPPHHRRPKSKSGPLGAPAGIGGSYSTTTSPLVPCFDGGMVGNFAGSPPFLAAGALILDGGCCGNGSSGKGGGGGGGGGRSYSANAEPYITRSVSVHGWSDMLIESSSSLPSSQDTIQDELLDSTKNAAKIISPVVLRKDMATQMSPEGSTHSSPKERPSFSISPPLSAHPIAEVESHHSKLEVRDVQVDDRVTVTRWSKKQIARGSAKGSTIIEWKKKTIAPRASAWEVSETAKSISKCKREEAKILAWENLQKAKAEAAMRKLEMKLEKKRSSSMDKILNKLRSAQRKAQEMRSAVTDSQSDQIARTAKRVSYFHKSGQMSSLSGCFTCNAF